MTLSEHVYYVAVAFKMTELVKQWICIRFFVKLEHSLVEIIWMIQKAAAMGKWWLATSSRQHTHSCITSCAVSWRNITSLRWLSPRYSQGLAPSDFWLFPKLKSPLKGKRFQTMDEIQENTTGQLMATGRTMWGWSLLWRGLRHHCPVYNVSCILFNKCLYFS